MLRRGLEGGSCLRLTGALAPGYRATVRLYQTKLALTDGTKVTVRAKTPSSTEYSFNAVVAFDDDPTGLTSIALSTTDTSGWKTYTADLSTYKDKTLVQLGLCLDLAESAKTDLAYDIRVGQLAVHTGAVTAPGAPSSLTIDRATTIRRPARPCACRGRPPPPPPPSITTKSTAAPAAP